VAAAASLGYDGGMLAVNARSPWKTALVGLVIASAAGRIGPAPGPSSGPARPVHVHVKLAPGGPRTAALAMVASRVEAMFAPLPPGVDDGRARWIRVRADGPAEAARLGNGGEDLDHRAYGRKFDRAHRDSGAIMVGAGGPPREGFDDRARLDFSNYGGRVDVQGWGRKVATLDYGDLQACGDPQRDRHYTGEFAGTSSASPIVAGAAVILEGIARQRGRVLAPAALRDLLRRTGTPQAGDTSQAIGPRPDLERAIRAL